MCFSVRKISRRKKDRCSVAHRGGVFWVQTPPLFPNLKTFFPEPKNSSTYFFEFQNSLKNYFSSSQIFKVFEAARIFSIFFKIFLKIFSTLIIYYQIVFKIFLSIGQYFRNFLWVHQFFFTFFLTIFLKSSSPSKIFCSRQQLFNLTGI